MDTEMKTTNIIGVYWMCDNGVAYVGDTVRVKATYGSIYYGKILSACEDGGFMMNDVHSISHSIHIEPSIIRELIFVRGNNGKYHARCSKSRN